ncbi:hypothetical protein Hanom_Chr08g00756071 [Helianthus anomalus]
MISCILVDHHSSSSQSSIFFFLVNAFVLRFRGCSNSILVRVWLVCCVVHGRC